MQAYRRQKSHDTGTLNWALFHVSGIDSSHSTPAEDSRRNRCIGVHQLRHQTNARTETVGHGGLPVFRRLSEQTIQNRIPEVAGARIYSARTLENISKYDSATCRVAFYRDRMS